MVGLNKDILFLKIYQVNAGPENDKKCSSSEYPYFCLFFLQFGPFQFHLCVDQGVSLVKKGKIVKPSPGF